jgi:hypothetical protein
MTEEERRQRKQAAASKEFTCITICIGISISRDIKALSIHLFRGHFHLYKIHSLEENVPLSTLVPKLGCNE